MKEKLGRTNSIALKTSLMFKNESQKNIIMNCLEYIKVRTGNSYSESILNILEEKLLPENNNAKVIAEQLYKKDKNLLDALAQVFELYSDGTNFKARWNNGLVVINFLSHIINDTSYPETDKSDKMSFYSNYNNVLNVIKQTYDDSKDDKKNVTESPIKLGEFYINEAKEEPQFFKSINIVSFIKDNWDKVGNNTYTYRMLAALCRTLSNDENAARVDCYVLEFVDVLKNISKEWN